jgi:DNA-binding SARP family transcriptional activator
MSVDVDLLGAVALRRAGVAQTLRRGKERALLARLALAAP